VRAAQTTGRYPDPLRSDTFCRELVGVPAGEASISECLRTLSEPTGDLEGIRQSRATSPFPSTGLLSRSPLLPALLAQAVRLQGPPHAFPRDGVCDRGAQGVFRSEEHLQEGGPDPANRARTMTTRRRAILHKLFTACEKRARAFFIPRRVLL